MDIVLDIPTAVADVRHVPVGRLGRDPEFDLDAGLERVLGGVNVKTLPVAAFNSSV